MVKKAIALTVAVIMLFSTSIVSFCAEKTPTFFLDNAVAKPGEEIEIFLGCSGNSGITAWKFDVSYDKDAMELVSCDTKGVFEGVMTSKTYDAYPYTLSWSNDLEDVYENGVIAKLKFHIKESAPTGEHEIDLSYDPENVYSVKLDDSGMETNVHFDVKNSIVTINDDTITNPTFKAESTFAKPGEDVTIKIHCLNNPGITAWKFDVSYDQSIMRLDSCDTSGAFEGVMTSKTYDAYPYTLSWSNDLEDVYENGVIAKLKFHIKESAPTGDYRVKLSYDPDNVYSIVLDDTGMETNVNFDVIDGVITVSSNNNSVIYGDVDFDEQITSADALEILRTSVGMNELTPKLFKLADVDVDEQITSADALDVLRYSVGMASEGSIVGTKM